MSDTVVHGVDDAALSPRTRVYAAAVRAAANLDQIGEADRAELGRVNAELLRYLMFEGLESSYYLATGSNSWLQDLYEKIWSVQVQAQEEMAAVLNANGLTLRLAQGGDRNFRYYCGHAFGRRGDIDILVYKTELQRFTDLFETAGYRRGLMDIERQTIVPMSDEQREQILREQSIKKDIAFVKLVGIEADSETSSRLPKTFNPLLNIDGSVTCALTFEPVLEYGSPVANEFYDRFLIGSYIKGAKVFTPEIDLALCLYRLSLRLREGLRTGRLAADICSLTGQADLDHGLFAEIVKSLDMEVSIGPALDFIFPIAVGISDDLEKIARTARSHRRGETFLSYFS